MSKKKSYDFEIAHNLDQQINSFGITENAFMCEIEQKYGQNYKPRTLIDQTLEFIDPTPNVHTLFVQFNERFFWNVLLPVEVKWSNRMTSCAGTCTFHPRSKQCVITLSAPLLKLRPRKDLVETLLHEMIHGYLFLTNNNRDRDGHGPEFCKHMHRINQVAGTKISIYHDFHEEVRLHQQHWWRCNGPCQSKSPYFGMVRRATNRAPGPSDFWWNQHQQNCGGQFIKIKEPENFKAKNSKNNSKIETAPKNSMKSSISKWLVKPTISQEVSPVAHSNITSKTNINNPNSVNGFKKLGNNTNKVHGWGTGGPGSLNNSHQSEVANKKTSSVPSFTFSGTIGGSKTGVSNLLTKFSTTTANSNAPKPSTSYKKSEKRVDRLPIHSRIITVDEEVLPKNNTQLIECPVCNLATPAENINDHIDMCLKKNNEEQNIERKNNNGTPQKRKIGVTSSVTNKQPKLDFSNKPRIEECPVCNKQIQYKDINSHLDECLLSSDAQDNCSPIKLDTSGDSDANNASIISISDSSSSDSPSCLFKTPVASSLNTHIKNSARSGHKCLVCDSFIPPEVSLTDHLEDCIGSVFNDDLSLTDSDIEPIEDVASETDKHPCPVCMQLIKATMMNDHLDTCIKN